MSVMESAVDNSIKNFYQDAEIFITGGSGYIGKVLIEKLLRSCDGIKRIYLLMRPLKGMSDTQRIYKLSDNLLYKTLKASKHEALDKIHVVEGDASKLNLGLCDADLDKLKSCSVIFHAAASVRFDDPLKSAILLNTRGTREVCKLALTMPNLKAFVHVSTAYIQPKNLYVKEILYPAEDNWKTFVDYAENFDEELLHVLTPKLTKFAPNTYTFTKHLAEQVCIDYKKEFNLPIVIYRPSIVSATDTDPLPGWCDNLNGPMGMTFIAGLGINHVTHLSDSAKMNYCPIDFCVKGMILCSFKVWRDRMINKIGDTDVPVYNAASVRLVAFSSVKGCYPIVTKYPSMQAIGPPHVTFTNCVYFAWILRIFRNLIPSLIIDGILRLANRKPKLLKIQRIIFTAEAALKYFASRTFTIDNNKFMDLGLLIPDNEQADFSMKLADFSNFDFIRMIYLNGLIEIFKESPEDFPKARKRFARIIWITRIYRTVLLFIVLRYLNRLILNFNK